MAYAALCSQISTTVVREVILKQVDAINAYAIALSEDQHGIV